MKTKLLTFLAASGVAVLALAAPAAAHVTVNPSSAEQGGFTKLAIRVPNESDSASTTKIDLKLPDDHPLASVAVKPKAGWTYAAVTKPLATPITTDDGQVTEAVDEITWTATGDGIKPGEFDEFEISVGPLPTDTSSLAFKVIQTYSDGTEADWIELPDASGKEPDHPAPILELTAATSSESSGSSSSSSSTASESTASSSSATTAPVTSTKDDSGNGRGLAIVALAVGAVGVALGVSAHARARKATTGS